MYTFERITENEVSEAREIYLYYINNSTATFHKHEVSMDEMRELVIFNDDKYESYIIKDKTITCGYVILTRYKVREAFDQTAEVTIYLKHGYEGLGIGKKALAFIEERAKLKQLHTLIALVCGENKDSIRLFERSGYAICAHYKEVGYKFERWLDLIALQKIIK